MILRAVWVGFHLLLVNPQDEPVCHIMSGNEEFAQELARRWNLGEVKKTTPQIPKPPVETLTREEICENYVIKALEAQNEAQ